MKTYLTYLAVIFSVLLITSCNNAPEDHGNETSTIELNNGKKWNVNPEMTPYILEAEQVLLQYDGVNFNELAQKLEDQNKGLIKSCTMEGKSHEELHKWLYPHMQLIEKLDNAKNKEESEKIIGELKASFQTYHKYFQ